MDDSVMGSASRSNLQKSPLVALREGVTVALEKYLCVLVIRPGM